MIEKFRIEQGFEWNDDILTVINKVISESENKVTETILDHYMIDTSEMRELIEIKQRRNHPETRADRIRELPEEKLAALLYNFALLGSYDVNTILGWLRQDGDL